jgi:ferrochelatase
MSYLIEPEFRHGQAAKIGILLINLGTPDAPTAKAVRPYLKQFLSDPRVVEIPKALWWLILNGIILNTRPKKSAAKYASIWQKDGSPLRTHTEQTGKLLQGSLGEQLPGQPIVVRTAMRYGNPSVQAGLTALKAEGCDRILLVPLYPQYAASSSASALDEAFRVLTQMRNMPEVRTIKHFHDHPAYIAALAQHVRQQWAGGQQPDTLLLSFHGIPRFSLDKGDPYHCECYKTARLLGEALQLKPDQLRISFQSRFGRAEWLKPYTSEVLHELGKAGQRVDVLCPGFVVDCLETLEEIAMEGRDDFLNAGGQSYRYLGALNTQQHWIAAFASIISPHLSGWLATPEQLGNDAAESKASQLRALALGAKQ